MNKKTKKVIDALVESLKEGYRPQQVILFGSHAWGEPTDESDIDLLIVKDTRVLFFKRLLEVRKIVSQARAGYAFEPIVLTPKELKVRLEEHDSFFERIIKSGKVLYAA